MMVVNFDFFGSQYRLFNCYAPADKNERAEFLEVLKFNLPGRIKTIVAGDLNCIRSVGDRVGSGETKLDSTSRILNQIVTDFGLQDAALAAGKTSERVVFGKGVWKLNVELLEDVDVLERFRVEYAGWVCRKRGFVDLLEWWDWAKRRISGFFRNLAYEKRCLQREEEEKWKVRLQYLVKMKEWGYEVEEELEEARQRMKGMLMERGKRIVYQAKVRDLEEGESCSRFFFKKVVSSRDVLESVVVDEKEVVGSEVVEEVQKFYVDLYGGGNVVSDVEMEEYCDEVLEECLDPLEVQQLKESVATEEPLLRYVQRDKVVKGFVVPGGGGEQVKYLAYMDDVAFVGGSQADIDRVNLHVKVFCGMSGMAVNWEKSQLVSFGRPVPLNVEKVPVSEEIKVLGVVFDAEMKGRKTLDEVKGKVSYARQNKEMLLNLCEHRGIETVSGQTKEQLVRALEEHDEAERARASTSAGAAHDTPEEESLPPQDASGDDVLDDPPNTGMTSLEADLQLLGSAEPELRLKLILENRQAEREIRQAQREQAAQRLQAERESAERQHQLELAKLQQQNRSAGPAEREGERVHRIPLDKFPAMDKDSDIDTFLQGFERTCRQYGVPREQWARYLTPGLRGKALEAFVSLPQEEETDFEAIKKAIIARYHLTPEVYRKRFRTVQRGPNDSYLDHACNLRTAFQQWLKGLSVETFDALQELIIKDQFLHTCPVEVRQFVRDREPKTVDEAAKVADAYTSNRASDFRRTTAPSWKGEKPARPSPLSTQRSQVPQPPGGRTATVDTRRCFACNKPGHISATCPEKKKEAPNSGGARNALCATRNAGSYAENLQPVTVGDTVTTGLRDTGAEVTLVHPQLVNPEEYIPGKTMAVKGVGGVTPAIPTALVHLDWGAGSGMKEVGVTDAIPTNVLLGTDLGRLFATGR
ncbi:uncharacterized protein [Hyperolius riggenbachi]|uniref:uncharacterized protein n=1 Tax=Hyperolius riggenbachi TaxID=752182 RepID=UPI0035A3367F